MNGDKHTDNTIIENILNGDEKSIVALYNKHKGHFVKWAMYQYKLGEDIARDIFQDAIVAFYRNIREGKITLFEHSAKTYLYAIAKYLIYAKLKDIKQRTVAIDSLEENTPIPIPQGKTLKQEAKIFIDKSLQNLGEPCYSLLKLYYYNCYSLEAIAREIESKNANTVKAQKARCIKKLKEMFENRFSEDDFFED